MLVKFAPVELAHEDDQKKGVDEKCLPRLYIHDIMYDILYIIYNNNVLYIIYDI